MANPTHVEILKQGVEVWNRWRYEDRGKTGSHPDFSNADLSRMYLAGVDLKFANMAGAQLQDTNLTYANLSCAYLPKANLQGAELTFANLSDLTIVRGSKPVLDPDWTISQCDSGVNLERANLAHCSLYGSDLSKANLIGAKFHSARLGRVRFSNTNLNQAEGLETCKHTGPSDVDFRTLSKSWPLPLSFLRGCGLPDALIDYLPSLLNQPIQFYSCFISYSSKDHALAERLYNDLQGKGVRCWFAPEHLKTGDRIRIGIDESIRLHDKLLLLLSKDSVSSDWVEQEVEKALERERKEKKLVLFPVRLDDAVMEVESGWPSLLRNTRNIADLRNWRNHDSYEKVFDRLLRDLKASEQTGPPDST